MAILNVAFIAFFDGNLGLKPDLHAELHSQSINISASFGFVCDVQFSRWEGDHVLVLVRVALSGDLPG